jgi:hypothetical protein
VATVAHRFWRCVCLIVGAAILVLPCKARADDTGARYAFARDAVETSRVHAETYWLGWILFYAVGAHVQAVRAGVADERGPRADLVVSTVKAVGGVVGLAVRPNLGIRDSSSFERMPANTPAERRARLREAETIMIYNADKLDNRYAWYRHALNVGVNGAGALIVGLGFDDWRSGLISAAIGVAVGELNIFTQPWQPESAIEDYQRRFGALKGAERWRPDDVAIQVSVVAGLGSAGLKVRY